MHFIEAIGQRLADSHVQGIQTLYCCSAEVTCFVYVEGGL